MQAPILRQHFQHPKDPLSYYPTSNNTSPSRPPTLDEHVEQLKDFLATAPQNWDPSKFTKKFMLPNNEYISCAFWKGVFHITGTDIIRCLTFRFQAYGRPVKNLKKFEEGVFSDLRNLKPGVDATLENPRSEFLELLYKHNCIRTQKKQKVFFWYSVPHEKLFMDALERDLKREALGVQPTTIPMQDGMSMPISYPSSGSLQPKKPEPRRSISNILSQDNSRPSSSQGMLMYEKENYSTKGLPQMNSSLPLLPAIDQYGSYSNNKQGSNNFYQMGYPEEVFPYMGHSHTTPNSPVMSGTPATSSPNLANDTNSLNSFGHVGFTTLLPASTATSPLMSSSMGQPQSQPASGMPSPVPYSMNEPEYSQLLNDPFYLPNQAEPNAGQGTEQMYNMFNDSEGYNHRRPSFSYGAQHKFSPYGNPHEENRFPCTFHGCNKRFKRFDLLQKHTKTHLE